MSLEKNEHLLAKSVLGLLRIASFARTDALVEESALHRVASRSDCRSPRSPRHRFLSGGSQGGGGVCREILQRGIYVDEDIILRDRFLDSRFAASRFYWRG
jgi:hypothetical protein